VEATNGYELSDDLPVERVLLLPSYWFRPWLIINRIDDVEVLTSPVSDEHLALPSAAPSPALVKLTKALGDEGRLRLLRRMGGGPITLADAMDELDLAKTTAHHHLSILRQAGLVVIRGEGRDSRYALRAHAPTAAAKALEEYLGSAVPLTAPDD
jgi:DNA-binding transcriptional ArsR family regulator